MTRALSLLVPIVGGLWVFFAAITIVMGRRRRSDPTYKASFFSQIGVTLLFLVAFVGAVCALLLNQGVPPARIPRVLLLYDMEFDSMLLRFGLIAAYGITAYAVISILRKRRS